MPESARLEVLGWSGCPSTGGIEEWVEGVCARAGVAAPRVEVTYVETEADAASRNFIGSPTFLHDGADLFPEPGATPALTCRLYRRRDGRPSPLPDPDDFADIVARLGSEPSSR